MTTPPKGIEEAAKGLEKRTHFQTYTIKLIIFSGHYNDSPTVAKQGSPGSPQENAPISGNWQWDSPWEDVCFTTPSVCQVRGGKVGYDEVDAEPGHIHADKNNSRTFCGVRVKRERCIR
ncbi:Hypothetical protein SMAX5B_006495 [Scophthalmus maximus]|uniref:Uncharacterized protein n=1 Tax=Scophthalmus maximus TaxID=52904 RepID=A0A2U9BJQ2_SCOMX|nr:Hypothetical protein SMAX5B_006495 [Scophthalmus maximus]